MGKLETSPYICYTIIKIEKSDLKSLIYTKMKNLIVNIVVNPQPQVVVDQDQPDMTKANCKFMN